MDALAIFLDGIERQIELHLTHFCPDCPPIKTLSENLALVRSGIEKLNKLAAEGSLSEQEIQEQLREAGSLLVLFLSIPCGDSEGEPDIENVRSIEEPFRGSYRFRIEDLCGRISSVGPETPPDILILWAIEVLKLFAIQHVEDLDSLGREIGRVWSSIDETREAGISLA